MKVRFKRSGRVVEMREEIAKIYIGKGKVEKVTGGKKADKQPKQTEAKTEGGEA